MRGLRRRVHRNDLEAEVRDLRDRLARLEDGDDTGGARTLTRRGLLTTVGGAAAGAVAGAVSTAAPAAAADGDNLIIGQANTNTTNPTQLTGSTDDFGDNSAILLVTQNAATGSVQQAIRGNAAGTAPNTTGVHGVSQSFTAGGIGVRGQRAGGGVGRTGGVGVQGDAFTADGVGVRARANVGAALLLVDDEQTMPPTAGVWIAGSFANASGQLWYCYEGGTGSDSQWVRLSSTFVPAPAPVRVYDSRPGEAPLGVTKGQLNPNQERVVDVGLNAAVPTTASAVLCNLSVVNTVNAGFLAMFKEDVPYPGHSSVNWSASNQITGNNATPAVAVDGAAVNVRVRCGGSGGTQFVVDVLGHYL